MINIICKSKSADEKLEQQIKSWTKKWPGGRIGEYIYAIFQVEVEVEAELGNI